MVFKENGLLNNIFYFVLVATAILMISGCGTSDSEDYVSFDQLKKSRTETDITENPSCPVMLKENLKESTKNGDQQTKNTPLIPVIALRPDASDITISKKSVSNNTAKKDLSTTAVLPDKKIKLLVKDRKFRKEGIALRVNYDDLNLLKVLNMEPVPKDAADHFPGWLSQLDGEQIRLRGYMFPPFREKGLSRFVLARDDKECCFGGLGKIYDLIPVKLKENQTTHYIYGRPFDVVGTFHIDIVYDDDEQEMYRLYTITDAVVIEK